MHEINVEEIMDTIRNEIKEKGYEKNQLSFVDVIVAQENGDVSEGFNKDVCANLLSVMNAGQMHIFPTPIMERNPISLFFKKVIRKLTKFLFYQILTVQNGFNANTVGYCIQVSRFMEQTEQELQEKDAQIQELKMELEQIKKLIK